jgi:transcriptional regulator with XRE-family HTH domain
MEYFAEKLKKIISKEGLSASKFAEKIGVQRSSVSHILSGRNKPSLDFVLKTYKSIENIDLEWLLSENTENESHFEHTPPYSSEIDSINQQEKNTKTENNIDRIVIFFNNGSFKIYNN